MTDLKQLRDRLASAQPGELYSVLISIGKAGAKALERDVARYLSHEDPELRSAAIRVLGFYWELPAFQETASRMIDEETESAPRSVAIMAWAAYHRDSRSPQVMRRLYALLADENNDSRVRGAAMDAMMVVSAVPTTERPIALDAGSTDKIDWAMVRRMLANCGIEDELPVVSAASQARQGIRTITYDWGTANNPSSHFGRLLVTFNGEIELVNLEQQRGPQRRAWRANLPTATWNFLVDTLNRYQFPRPVTDAEPRVPGSSPTTISWERYGEVESVTIGGRTADYSDVNRIVFSIIEQMAPGVLRGKHRLPNTDIESPRELPPSTP